LTEIPDNYGVAVFENKSPAFGLGAPERGETTDLDGIGLGWSAPLFRPARDKGATVFLDLETLEPHKDQWAYLSALGRMTPQEVRRAADKGREDRRRRRGHPVGLPLLNRNPPAGPDGPARPARGRDP
jgi:hypothetical protein